MRPHLHKNQEVQGQLKSSAPPTETSVTAETIRLQHTGLSPPLSPLTLE